ncbi:MAG TPA: hypothetical protein VFD21_05035 [Vicinamibacterales bacterium]|jgi:hypothetical protein|nr:hypothetical protein [Vicinamibacterales bacterium]
MTRTAGVVAAVVCFALAPVLLDAQRGSGQGRRGGGQGEQGGTTPAATQGAKPPVKIAGDFDKVKVLEPGPPTPRTADGHPDLSGRYYPNHAGRMLQGAYRIPEPIMRQYDAAKTPQENPVFRPDAVEKYQHPTPYGSCPPGGTPTSITTQATEHGPLEIVQVPGRVWLLTEFPQTIRMVPTDGRKHSPDPDPSFNGESVGRWEGDTLVIDTVAIDTRMRNISVGRTGDANAWLHSEKEHVIERFSRPSKNYLMYTLTVEDPEVLVKPFTSAPHAWTLAQDPNDVWTEYICTANEEPDVYKNLDQKTKQEYERSGRDGTAQTGRGRQ